MAIKSGQILHVANQFVVDRLQTGGPGNLNIPQDRIYELGNYQSVGIVRDVPDLTFSADCLEVDTEVEAILTGAVNPYADAASTKYELAKAIPIDITSPWKSPYGQFASVRGVVIPALWLESAAYKYGLKDHAGETFSLRGDSIYFVPGTPWLDVAAGDGTTVAYTLVKGPALPYTESGATVHVLSVSVDGVRQTRGADFVDTATTVTFTTAPANSAVIRITYGSATSGTWPQAGQSPYGAGVGNLVHQGLAVKPAAIKGKDIDVYFSTLVAGSPVEVRWPDVQAATIDWKVTLDPDFEFGNPNAVDRDPTDVPAVSGTVELRPRSVERLFDRLSQITGVDPAQIIGPQASVAGALRVEIRNPESGGTTATPAGTVLKTHYVPDARFTIPGYEGRTQQKMNNTLNWESDSGVLETYKGVRA